MSDLVFHRRRILKLARRGKQRATGNCITLDVDERNEDAVALLGGASGLVELEALVFELEEVFGYLWVEGDGSLSYEVVTEDPVARWVA